MQIRKSDLYFSLQGMQDMGMGGSGRSSRGTPAVHQMNANLVQYPGLNGYRVAQQGAVPSYIPNSAGFMNQLNQGQVTVLSFIY